VTAAPNRQSDGDGPPPTVIPRPRIGIDTVVLLVLLTLVTVQTPLGRLGLWTARHCLRQPQGSLLATLLQDSASPTLGQLKLRNHLLAYDDYPEAIEDAARKSGVPRPLLMSAVTTVGRCNQVSCYLPTPPHLHRVVEFQSQGPEISVLEYARGITAASQQLDHDPKLGMEALYASVQSVQRSISRARSRGHEHPSHIDNHGAFLNIERHQFEGLRTLLATDLLRGLQWPTRPQNTISSPFGHRRHPITGVRHLHNGVDIRGPVGEPIRASQKGLITAAGRDSLNGKYVRIDHGFGVQSTYCHLNQIDVTPHTVVKQGQHIGTLGSTGRTTGPHLHYTLKINRTAVNPQSYGAPLKRNPNPLTLVKPDALKTTASQSGSIP